MSQHSLRLVGIFILFFSVQLQKTLSVYSGYRGLIALIKSIQRPF